MDQLITLTIDDREVSVPPDTSVLDAARKLEIDIPTMCHYAKLTSVGACRLCLIEIEKVRGLQPACATPVRPEMVVHTNTPAVLKTRIATLEFLLTNHPLDCPVCDKGGECDLQDQVFAHGPGVSRYIEDKRHKAKAHVLGDHIIMDQERCILCRRCIRFLGEWADDVQLGLIERGAKSYVDTFDGEPLTSIFSGNVIHLCPVGALTSRQFRFSARSWELDQTDSICIDCAAGCNISIHSKFNRLKRIVPRDNEAVNDEWLCDRGQFDHSFTDPASRITRPMIRVDGELKPAAWDQALALVAKRLSGLANEYGGQAVGVIGSAEASNEANYLLQRLARGALRSNNVAMAASPPAGARLLPGNRQLEKPGLALIVGMNLADHSPIVELFARRGGLAHGTRFIVLGYEPTHLARFGTWLGCKAGTEVAVLNGLTRLLIDKGPARRIAKLDNLKEWVEDFTPAVVEKVTGVSANTLKVTAKELADVENLTILYGAAGSESADLRQALMNLALLTGAEGPAYIPLQANAIGALDMGLAPDILPGFQSFDDGRVRDRLARLWGQKRIPTDAGLTLGEMQSAAREGILIAAYVLGEPPAGLEEVEFLVVQSSQLDHITDRTDVVLPACSFAECEGSYTNLAGRVQLARAALRPMGESKPDWWILSQLGARLGKSESWTFESAGQVFAEIAKCVPAYAGMSYQSLIPEGQVRIIETERASLAEARFAL